MKQSLQLKVSHSLTMTPQLQQAIRLLQLSTLDLKEEIQQALDSNPMLEPMEEGDKATEDGQQNTPQQNIDQEERASSQSETLDRDGGAELYLDKAQNINDSESSSQENDWNQDIPNDLPVDTSWDDVYQSSYSSSSKYTQDNDYGSFESQSSSSETLKDHLLWQLNLTPFSDKDRVLAHAIIDDVQVNGLLSSSVEDLHLGLREQVEDLDLDEVEAVLHRVQQFDPPGVAGINLSDCLMIQLNQMSQDVPGLNLAKTIVREHLTLLANHDFKSLMRKLRTKENYLKQAIDLIHTLNPSPGNAISDNSTEYVVPDVFVSKRGQRWKVELNPETSPKIRINAHYASLIRRGDSSSDNVFLKDNLQEARWFIKSLQSRNETLIKVAMAIVDKQQQFLDHGEEAMKPMVLQDIAEVVEMHESTISRVTNNKYMHTPQGIFELKYFFSSHVGTESGGECSSTAIRAVIKKLIAAENGKKPLSDNKITQLLLAQGINVARRTIAKYRESMNIPPSNERKQLE